MSVATLLASSAVHRRRGGIAALLLALLTTAVAASETASPQVRVAGGALSGSTMRVQGTALALFRDIPYAAAPLGALRFKPPQPATAWTGVRQAKQFGPRCMQRAIFDDMVFRSDGMSEDCLHLNVWTPAKLPVTGGKLPVLVYFYGGGFVGGDGSESRYDGASLASRGIVTVTVSYRLGVFGFLALPALAAESPQHAAGNYGLLDQVAALRWVKANIDRFGGDANRITIGGESAGSMSVSALVTSPLSKGLIAGAIGESGAFIAPLAPLPLAKAQQQGEAFMHEVGATSLTQLRAMPAATLLAASAKGTVDATAVIDGYLLPERPAKVLARGGQAQVPLLLGFNSQEGYYPAILKQRSPTPANYRAALQTMFGAKARQALALYPGTSQAQVKASATALAGDLFIAHSTWEWMAMNRKRNSKPTFFYYFDQARPAKRQPVIGEPVNPGAVHSAEIEYALGNLDGNRVYAWTAADRAASKAMEGYVAQFIKTGNPNAPGLPHWPAAAEKDGGVLRQVIDAKPRTYVDQGAARQAFVRAWFKQNSQ